MHTCGKFKGQYSNKTIEFMFAGIDVLGPTQTHFKMNSEKGPKYIHAQGHK